MDHSFYDRRTKKILKEKVYGEKVLTFLLKENPISAFLFFLSGKFGWISSLYGVLQKTRSSAKKIDRFVSEFDVDSSEFQKQTFDSFNDFFTRKLKPECRPINPDEKTVVMPADGRYLVYPDVSLLDGIWVKGKNFTLRKLFQDENYSVKYEQGSLVVIRLCPSDYHRFHFPVSCFAKEPKKIRGSLYSVNPLALKKNIEILAENKRMLTSLQTEKFGEILMVEVGATNVGSIRQTYSPNSQVQKGEEKGFFSFGGSCILLFFEKDKVEFDSDLLGKSEAGIEVRGLMGESLAKLK